MREDTKVDAEVRIRRALTDNKQLLLQIKSSEREQEIPEESTPNEDSDPPKEGSHNPESSG